MRGRPRGSRRRPAMDSGVAWRRRRRRRCRAPHRRRGAAAVRWRAVGESWQRGERGPADEHVAGGHERAWRVDPGEAESDAAEGAGPRAGEHEGLQAAVEDEHRERCRGGGDEDVDRAVVQTPQQRSPARVPAPAVIEGADCEQCAQRGPVDRAGRAGGARGRQRDQRAGREQGAPEGVDVQAPAHARDQRLGGG